jgi:hypothetical protein
LGSRWHPYRLCDRLRYLRFNVSYACGLILDVACVL